MNGAAVRLGFCFSVLALLFSSCASLTVVETPRTPGVAAFATARSVTLAVKAVSYHGGGVELYQKLPGEEFFRAKRLDRVSRWVEYFHYPPLALTQNLPPDELGRMVLNAVEKALVGTEPFRFTLTTMDFQAMTISDRSQTGQIRAAANAFSIRTMPFFGETNPADSAMTAGSDVTVLVSVDATASSGRGSAQVNEEAVTDLRLDQGDHFVLVDVHTDIEVYDRTGALLYDSAASEDPYGYHKQPAELITILPQIHGSNELQAFERSAAFRELVAKASAISIRPYWRYLRPYIEGRYVEAATDKK